jgi:hypothetical protein
MSAPDTGNTPPDPSNHDLKTIFQNFIKTKELWAKKDLSALLDQVLIVWYTINS